MSHSHQCRHGNLHLEPSDFAPLAGFSQKTAVQRAAATTRSGRAPQGAKSKGLTEKEAEKLSSTFPAPLVLPWDDLNLDPEYPGQSFRAWLNLKERNKLESKRRVLYVADVPEITDVVGAMRAWTKPNVFPTATGRDSQPATKKRKTNGGKRPEIESLYDHDQIDDVAPPVSSDVIAYLSAFYRGMTVKPLPTRLRFTRWPQNTSSSSKPRLAILEKYVGLSSISPSGNEPITRIRVRPAKDAVFEAQLNVDDILDVAIANLPDDAYALVLLTNHDLFQDEADDFCCGLGYGGSRVSAVSSARYNPLLDGAQSNEGKVIREAIDRDHTWPASHCVQYIDSLLAPEGVVTERSSKARSRGGPLHAAVAAAAKSPTPSTAQELHRLWFSRVARTAAHELGHCFGIDHCIYYACSMQGTANMNEDYRQPPYLCPVCLAKVVHAISDELKGNKEDEGGKSEYVRRRYEALRDFCDKWKDVGMFAGFGEWLGGRLDALTGKV